MRLITAIAGVALLTTGAMAQSIDTSNKGNPNRAPGASQTGGKASMATTGQNADTVDKGNPNRPGKAMKKKMKKKI